MRATAPVAFVTLALAALAVDAGDVVAGQTTTTQPTTTQPTTTPTTTPIAPPPTTLPPLGAAVVACETGPTADDRAAVFSGSMPALAGAPRLSMRFDLYWRPSTSASWRRLRVPRWGVWQRSRPGARGFVYTKRVSGLLAPSAYRATIQFRWRTADGRPVRARQRTTGACIEPDPRADLAIGRVLATALPDGDAAYAIAVSNRGHGDAGAFSLVLATGGYSSAPIAVDALPAGATRTVRFEGPPCSVDAPLRISLDPDNVVAEVHQRQAPIVRACPL